MRAEHLPRVYAQAIYEKALEGWLENLRLVGEALRGNPGLLEVLADPAQSFAARQRRLDPLIPSSMSREQRNFLYTLLKDNHLELLDDILGTLKQIAERGPTPRAAQVVSAIPLKDEERSAIQERLKARFGPDLGFDFLVDPKILGGVVVRVGDVVIDDSLSTRLTKMQESLATGQ